MAASGTQPTPAASTSTVSSGKRSRAKPSAMLARPEARAVNPKLSTEVIQRQGVVAREIDETFLANLRRAGLP